jgi:hypothetical protein
MACNCLNISRSHPAHESTFLDRPVYTRRNFVFAKVSLKLAPSYDPIGPHVPLFHNLVMSFHHVFTSQYAMPLPNKAKIAR